VAKIFISYTSKDRAWAQWIGVTLRDNGHVPFVHEWEIGAGENIPRWMDEKIKAADRLLGVFSDAYTQAIYSGAERAAAFWQDPDAREPAGRSWFETALRASRFAPPHHEGRKDLIPRRLPPYSHSIVPGGLLVMS
jgi:hypothetical protein